MAAVLVLAGCSENDTQTTQKQDNPMNKTEMANAWNDVKDFTYEQKEAFVSEMKSLGDEVGEQLQDVGDQLEGASDDAQVELEQAYDNFQDNLDKMANASEDGWDTARDNMEQAWNELQQAFKDATKSS